MGDVPPYPDSHSDTGDDTGVGPDCEPTISTPRWVEVFGIIAAVVVLLFVILLLAGGGQHGPGRHTGGDGGHTPPGQHP